MPAERPVEREDIGMDRARISRIADQWMIPTSKTAYMAGLESKPVIAAARGVWVIDTEGREYLDFGSGQMAAALGHNHPRYYRGRAAQSSDDQSLDQDVPQCRPAGAA
jgi:4-aminobutyrate aminotransferase-like enzyme